MIIHQIGENDVPQHHQVSTPREGARGRGGIVKDFCCSSDKDPSQSWLSPLVGATGGVWVVGGAGAVHYDACMRPIAMGRLLGRTDGLVAALKGERPARAGARVAALKG
jgi:hypothetical protein